MIAVRPISVEGYGVRLEPLSHEHNHQLAAAAADGKLWELWLTSVPEPEKTEAYVATALGGQRDGHMLPWAVRELTSGMDHWEHALSRYRTRDRSSRNRLHVVREALATEPRQHRL